MGQQSGANDPADDPFLDGLFTPNPAPRNLVGKVYGTSKTVPSGAKFWIEGVTPGKITLEYRIQKDGIDQAMSRTFEVCNEWPLSKWERAVIDEIYLDSFTGSSGSASQRPGRRRPNLTNYKVVNDFLANRQYLYAVHEYYAKLHGQDSEKFLWAGLAKQAGAPVYAGLSDAQNGRAGLAIATFGIIYGNPASYPLHPRFKPISTSTKTSHTSLWLIAQAASNPWSIWPRREQ